MRLPAIGDYADQLLVNSLSRTATNDTDTSSHLPQDVRRPPLTIVSMFRSSLGASIPEAPSHAANILSPVPFGTRVYGIFRHQLNPPCIAYSMTYLPTP